MVRTIDKATLAPTLTTRLFGDVAGVTGNFVPPALARYVLDTVNVLDPTFGVTANGTADDTAGIQAAIDTGKNVFFPDATYRAANLTSTTAGQALIAGEGGLARITKNANGPILTASGANFQMQNLCFRGESATPAFTGDNIVLTGSDPRIYNCGSRWAYGRALKATGTHVHIIGTADIWQTADQTATGYDIEIGVSGTATLYHILRDIYTSQSTGGVKLTDVGEHVLSGGQIGKLTIAAGTSPAGTGGGKTSDLRILGDVSVGLSNGTFVGCHFSGSVDFVFEAGTSGCRLGIDNIFGGGATVTNNGNANNLIMREVSAGSVNTTQYGADASVVSFSADPANSRFRFPAIRLNNNTGLRFQNAADSGEAGYVTVNASDDLTVANSTSNRTMTLDVTGASSRIQGYVNSVARFIADATGIRVGSLATTAPVLDAGAGDPEGVKTAPVGSIWMRSDGGALTSVYFKESGTGNTGWVAK